MAFNGKTSKYRIMCFKIRNMGYNNTVRVQNKGV